MHSFDEYTFSLMQDYQTALGVLQQHWTWITEEDFIEIAGAGLTHVRRVYPSAARPFTHVAAHVITMDSAFLSY